MEPANLTAAVIDIGSNTIKMTVGKTDKKGGVQILHNASIGTRLAEGLDSSGKISKKALERTLSAVLRQVSIAKSHNAENIRIVATSAAREAENKIDLIDMVRNNTGYEVEIISSEDEGKYSHLAISKDALLRDFDCSQLVVDIGGGSTELVFGQKDKIISVTSVKIGAVKLTEKFLMMEQPSETDIEAAQEYAISMIANLINNCNTERIIAIGGSAINLARIWKEVPEEKTDDVHGVALTSDNLRQSIEGIRALSPEMRRTLVGLEPQRADIIIAGAIILDSVLKTFEKTELYVSTRGLRHGVLYSML